MLVPALKQVAYDPSRFIDIETVEEAVHIITTPTEGLTSKQRWENETPALMRLFERFIKPESNVLDYGCGIGRLSKPLVTMRNCRVVGVDISSNMRALAASMVDSDRFAAMHPEMFDSIFSPEVTSFVFDAAISVWALQHCIDLDAAVSRIGYSMRKGGHLVIVNNVTRCLPVEGGEWADDGIDVHKLIEDAGFSTVERGVLDEAIAPGWMQQGTFWAAYERS